MYRVLTAFHVVNIHSLCRLYYKYTVSYEAYSQQSAIYCFLVQLPVPSPSLKLTQ